MSSEDTSKTHPGTGEVMSADEWTVRREQAFSELAVKRAELKDAKNAYEEALGEAQVYVEEGARPVVYAGYAVTVERSQPRATINQQACTSNAEGLQSAGVGIRTETVKKYPTIGELNKAKLRLASYGLSPEDFIIRGKPQLSLKVSEVDG